MGILDCFHIESICGVDVDHIFSYSTIKYVRILDRRLGLLKVLLLSFIAIYVLVYQIWYEGGYLQPQPVNGYSRFILQQPTVDGCDPRKVGCYNDFRNREDLPYCLESPLNYTGGKLHCRYVDSLGVQNLMTNAIAIGTRGIERKQSLLCDDAPDAKNCPLIYSQPVETDKRFYIADIDRYRLLIDHGVLPTLPGVSGESREMIGRIMVPKGSRASYLCEHNHNATTTVRGNTRARSAPCYVKPNKTSDGFDVIDLDVLLAAADANLDDISHSDKTYRETGGTLMIEIHYSNFFGWFLRKPAYTYKISLVKGSEFKHYETYYEPYPQERTVLSLAGLHISTLHSGFLYWKSFNYFLIQLTTSLTLLAIANTIIDLLALYTLPDREDYWRAKYDTTDDFSDLRKAKTASRLGLEQDSSSTSIDAAGEAEGARRRAGLDESKLEHA